MFHFFRNRRRTPLAEIEAERICLIKPSALGDVIQTLPVLTALRTRFPNAHIAWVINRSYADLLASHPHLNEVIPFERGRGKPWSRAVCRSFAELCESLRQRQFDLVCDLQGLLRSGLLARATMAPRRIGLGDAREAARFFFTDVVDVPEDNMSAVDRYWLLVEALGIGSAAKQFVISVEPAIQAWAEGLTAGWSGLRIAIHAGARWMTKRWPIENFVEIAQRLQREFDVRFVLIGGGDEMAGAHKLESALPGRCFNLVGQTSLKQLAAILARVNLLITNDSGPMHLAAAVGTSVAALFTCTSPVRARPYGSGHVILATNIWCAASYLKKCSRMDCMTELTPDRVWLAIRSKTQQLLAERQNPAA